ncbi:MAG TPA: xanthine dehydrogenase accessory protein XdhC [Nocardioides sp.]|uniref:xanthine dehydrogenase accessory protein XdhC n=1 Tax=uncultured Nocardioides sp. TaxID=198441 RepID=UPI000ED42905|nr:xanthine dehydrogenase accessory protein XdhC [uncultured Nocardioides sp.]HCB06486.1 xanthine dehydrogenase accessory protein XdhC [Nocardioides sp.]HRD62517.1 xanthine dehydrogenase accessory protein XdhC [Nocardioides sp.]HRI96352.1 xanthine dehydrogenase accessory protein XdhC [Nocardioides sp.]HRK45454.1 xanthine dehydrogenase accessory protein XdhC [Nocardioides sp.]
MTTWFEAVAALRAAREAGILVTVTEVRGHAPREAGAKMVVSADRSWASIGGGNLEEEAVRRARELISSGAAAPVSYTAQLSDKAPFQHGVQCCGGEVTVLLDPLPVVPSVAIFGLGHVGLELARILARHDLELHLVDSRSAHLSEAELAPLADAVAGVHTHHVPVIPELLLSELPPGTRVLVLTHDHAEDLAIIDAALRCEHLGSIGLIGSSAKWARFQLQLAAAGFAPEVIARVETPIGFPGVTTSKDPAAIAVSVAAALLSAQEKSSVEREGVRRS